MMSSFIVWMVMVMWFRVDNGGSKGIYSCMIDLVVCEVVEFGW